MMMSRLWVRGLRLHRRRSADGVGFRAEAQENVKDWLKDQGYPSPDPKDQ